MDARSRHSAAHKMDGALLHVLIDLHVHTVVSACAEVEMIPPLIIRRARELGLGMIAVTDHNTVENLQAVQRAAEGSGITVLAGMEVQTREEVHILCLFDTLDQALAWQQVVYAHLPALPNQEKVFGAQFVVDETGDFVCMNERLLQAATYLSLERVIAGVRDLDGLPIAAHVDRQAFGLLASLGFIPAGLALGGLEISCHTTPLALVQRHPDLEGWPLVMSGDAHRLSEMRASTLAVVGSPDIAELEYALRGERGREIRLLL